LTQHAYAGHLADALRYEPCSPTCANWLRYGITPKNPREACVPDGVPATPTAANTSAKPDAASWSPADGPARPSPTTAPTAKPWLMSTLGITEPDPSRYTWEPVTPGDHDHMPPHKGCCKSSPTGSAGAVDAGGAPAGRHCLDMPAATETRMEVLRTQLRDAARQLTGAKVLAARLYGVGPITALALTCWLAGEGRFSSSRKAVRFTGLDITVWSTGRKGPPGRLSRQGPPVLRWALYEAGKTHARASAPDHAYYAAVRDRKNGKRAALSEARKIVRQACHILTELGDDALTAA
jgi:hypothetical protein